MSDVEQNAKGEAKRRTIIQWLTAVFLSLWGVGIVAALASYLKPPSTPRSAGRSIVRGGRADNLQPGTARMITHGITPIYVLRLQSGELTAVSAVCTHFQCILNWDDDNMTFSCPCHHGSFSPVGEVMSGLPTKALRSFEVEVRRGEIQVRI